MHFFANPFYLLKASSLCTVDEIQRLASTSGQEQLATLLSDPQQRLIAELRWFPHTNIKDFPAFIYSHANADGKGGITVSDRFVSEFEHNALALLNAEVVLFLLNLNNPKIELVLQFIANIQQYFEALSPRQVMRSLNKDREVAGIPRLESLEKVKEELDVYGRDLARKCIKFIMMIDDQEKIGPSLATLITASSRFSPFTLELCATYEQLLGNYIHKQIESVYRYIYEICKKLEQKTISTEEIQTRLSRLLDALRYQRYLLLPLQMRAYYTMNKNYEPATHLLRLLCNFGRLLSCCGHRPELALTFLENIKDIFGEPFYTYALMRKSTNFIQVQPSLEHLINKFTFSTESPVASANGYVLTSQFLYMPENRIFLPKVKHITFSGYNGEVCLNSVHVTLPLPLIGPLKRIMLPYLSAIFLLALQEGAKHTLGDYTISFTSIEYKGKSIDIDEMPHINKATANSFVLNTMIHDLKKNGMKQFCDLLSMKHSTCFKSYFKKRNLELQQPNEEIVELQEGCNNLDSVTPFLHPKTPTL